MLKKVCVIGHFGFGRKLFDGQTIKTKNVTCELEKKLGAEEIKKIDTCGGIKVFHKVFFEIIKAFKECENIILILAENGIQAIVPLSLLVNMMFRRNLHYTVIGGWLPVFLKKKFFLSSQLKKFNGIYVETALMKIELQKQGFKNILVMPNFKNIPILKPEELNYIRHEPYKVCTFSRVMKEKGIEEAIEAVRAINENNNRITVRLDIYGQIGSEHKEWFDNLMEKSPEYINYSGIVSPEKSVDTLKHYYALLFPTYYSGEGFAGTLIDALAAGVPVIASDWKFNSEIISEGKTGLLFHTFDTNDLKSKIEWALNNPQKWNEMKIDCLQKANKFLAVNVIDILLRAM